MDLDPIRIWIHNPGGNKEFIKYLKALVYG
jgi:hypothetical protein